MIRQGGHVFGLARQAVGYREAAQLTIKTKPWSQIQNGGTIVVLRCSTLCIMLYSSSPLTIIPCGR